MGKPSIFSSDYKRKMKRRKRRTVIICFLLVFLGVNFYLYSRLNKNISGFNVKNYISSLINKKADNTDKKVVKPEVVKKQPAQDEIQEPVKVEKSYSFKLSDGKDYKAIYEENSGVKTFKTVTGDNKSLEFNINPEASGIVIYDAGVQSIIYMNSAGATVDLSKKIYVSSGGSQYTKENIMKNKVGYVWAANPKFIDNENVAYVSQLPWFKKAATKYLWIVNIKNPDAPTVFEKINGTTMVLDKLDTKGLTILIDGKPGFINASGELIEAP